MKAILPLLTLCLTISLSAQERITLLFVGDLMQHQAQIDAARTPDGRYDYQSCFALVKEQIASADLAIGNLEVTLGGKPYNGYPAFSAPNEYLQAIKDAGFDILMTANNHCLDRGKKGLERTIMMLDSLQIPYAGTYKNEAERKRRYPLLINKKGFRIALLNYTYGTNGIQVTAPHIVNYIDKDIIRKDILNAQACRPDVLIAFMHWGDEYQSLPNRNQKELADWLLQQGVTHVIGAHPHVIQPMELRTNGNQQHVVVYSLGNFISNMQAINTDGGLIFTMQLEKYPLPTPIPPRLPARSYAPSLDSLPILYPYCRITDCGYNLVWVARPELTGEKNHILYPVNHQTENLPQKAINYLKIFTEKARKLLQQHNVGIHENKK